MAVPWLTMHPLASEVPDVTFTVFVIGSSTCLRPCSSRLLAQPVLQTAAARPTSQTQKLL